MADRELEYKSLVCELCRQFFQAGWVTGTGGSISIKDGDKIYMTPSGVQKERILPDEVFTVDIKGDVVATPVHKVGCNAPKLSDCAPLFLHAYQQRKAGAVLHSHAISCNLVTSILEGISEFTISHQEMIKGIDGHGYFDTLTIPIIENTAWEHELADSLGEAIAKYPKACAVLVRRHGMYVWGKDWQQAKRHGECLHYLLEIALEMHKLGMDVNTPVVPVGYKRQCIHPTSNIFQRLSFKHLLLDIEGTTTPITFVRDVLFPYSSVHVRKYLESNWDKTEVQEIVKDVVAQSAADGSNITSSIDDVTSFLLDAITKDRKITPLKRLQGLVWAHGYANGDLKGSVFVDVPANLRRLSDAGAKISIYSSGSRQAQQLLFQHTIHGDLRAHFTAYFDTKVGLKGESASYSEIVSTLGLNSPGEALFVTDVLAEAKAASAAGLQVLLSVRPGNADITETHSFKTISDFALIV